MENARFVRLLRTLTPKELRSFVRYVQSPYFNRNERLVALIAWLQKKDLTGPLDKKEAFQTIYGKKVPFQEQQLYDHFSALLRLLEGFLAHQKYQSQPLAEKRFLLESLLERNADDLFRKHHSQAKKWVEEKATAVSDRYYQTYRLSQYADDFFGHQRKRNLDAEDSLQEAARNLDSFYLSAKLDISCEMLNRNNIINTTYEPILAKEICNWLEQPEMPFGEVPMVAIYYRIFMTLTDSETETHYEQLVKLLNASSELFPQEVSREMYVYAINYCTKQINRGNPAYLEKIFELFQELLQKEILIEEGYLAHWHFKNIATVGLRLKKFGWVREFLENYREKIHPEQRENAYNFNLSTLLYEQDRLPEAMKQLQKVVFTDVYYDLSARSLILKIYYETEEYDSLIYHIKAFQTYLRRNKQVSGYQRKIYHNLLRLVKKLVRIRLQRDPEKAEQMMALLQDEIKEIKAIADVKWLNSKVSQIKILG